MITKKTNLSDYNPEIIPSGKDFNIGIVVSEWNSEITNSLLDGAYNTLLKHDVAEENITVERVPGSFELPSGAKFMLKYGKYDAIICLGCVIQGETRHFDFICDAVANAIAQLAMEENRPVIFGVLTTNDMQQAQDRSGGKHGNKGVEAAVTALKMADLRAHLKHNSKK
ncbi:MAG: 6,7-dimethyl-8-ribityllumazine synthase [Bacteroidales bacterium]|jgi:6,7-dimethyl-8-ribityllumazine synthase|nr:6,7-dimethyl-8-ribityllumazine synthase [Bacteroidales bacterium]